MIERGTVYWIHTDHLGTPLAVTDADRRIVWRATYEPFGKANAIEDPDADGIKLTLNLRFPGQYADAESGTHYNLMRDYDPETGRYGFAIMTAVRAAALLTLALLGGFILVTLRRDRRHWVCLPRHGCPFLRDCQRPGGRCRGKQ